MGGYRASFRHLGLMVSDLALINLSYLFTFTLRLGRDIPWSNLHDFVRVAPWLSVMAALVFYLFGLYSDWIDKNPAQIIYAIAFSLILLNLLAMGLIYLTQSFAVPRSVSLLTPLVEMLVLTLTRLSIWSLYRRHFFTRRVLVVGEDAEESKAVAKKFLSYANGRFSLAGLVHGWGDKGIEDIEAEMGRLGGKVDIVAVSSGIAAQGRLVDYCIRERKEMLIVPDVLAVLLQSSDTRFVDDSLMLALKPPGLRPGQRLVKRVLDVMVSSVGLLVLSPILLFLALLIRLMSPGPALFKQERLGEGGKPFEVLKFRSMVDDAEELTGPVLAGNEDPRITKLGALLRATRLDELPQLINVLRGDMSLIGPRPEREFFVSQFAQTIPYYRYRMEVKPGITGLAQVMGRYTTSAEDKLRFDLMYIRNYSLLQDLRILLLTARVVFQREKAAGVELDLEDAVGKIAG